MIIEDENLIETNEKNLALATQIHPVRYHVVGMPPFNEAKTIARVVKEAKKIQTS